MDRQTRMYDNFDKIEQRTIEEILNIVYDALEERGYNAIDQMVGYILSGDPSYITSHNNARNVMRRSGRRTHQSISPQIMTCRSIKKANSNVRLFLLSEEFSV